MFSTKSQLFLGRLLRFGGACLTIVALSTVSANAWIHSASAHDLHQAVQHESSAHAADAHLDEAADEVEAANEAAHYERQIAEVHEMHDAEHQAEVIAHAHEHAADADDATLHLV